VDREERWEGDSKKSHDKKKSDKGEKKDTVVKEEKTIPYSNNNNIYSENV
jgi:hypothetical protein